MTAFAGFPGLDVLIADLAESETERSVMLRGAELLAYAASETPPPPAMREHVLDGIAKAASEPATFESRGFYFARGAASPWREISDGIEVRFLWADRETGARAMLVRMPPETNFPEHLHEHVEDLYVVDGDATVAGVYMRAGDYCRALQGSVHSDMRSGPTGVSAFVVQR